MDLDENCKTRDVKRDELEEGLLFREIFGRYAGRGEGITSMKMLQKMQKKMRKKFGNVADFVSDG